jgi:hypothetical protein
VNWRDLFRGRSRPADLEAEVAAERSAASRAGYVTLHDRERAKIRKATITLAEKIGRPDLAEPLR